MIQFPNFFLVGSGDAVRFMFGIWVVVTNFTPNFGERVMSKFEVWYFEGQTYSFFRAECESVN